MNEYSCIMLKTTNKKANIKYVCCICLPFDLNCINSYSIFWSILSTIWIHNTNNEIRKKVKSIIMPAFYNPNIVSFGMLNKLQCKTSLMLILFHA